LPKNKRTLTSSDDNSTSGRKQIKLKLNPSLPLYSTLAAPLSASVASLAMKWFKHSASEAGTGSRSGPRKQESRIPKDNCILIRRTPGVLIINETENKTQISDSNTRLEGNKNDVIKSPDDLHELEHLQ
jgi:hypothetical protein